LKENGFKIPEELSIVGFDDISFSSIIEPPLTTVATDKIRLGREAFKSLIKNIETGSISQIILPVELKVRNSTKTEAMEILSVKFFMFMVKY